MIRIGIHRPSQVLLCLPVVIGEAQTQAQEENVLGLQGPRAEEVIRRSRPGETTQTGRRPRQEPQRLGIILTALRICILLSARSAPRRPGGDSRATGAGAVVGTSVRIEGFISRSSLERKFRSYLARSPQADIPAITLARAKQLLTATDKPIHRIAELVGYQHIEYFKVAFKREIGQTPGQYRQRARTPGGRGTVAQRIERAPMI